jgi:hypothetical protein
MDGDPEKSAEYFAQLMRSKHEVAGTKEFEDVVEGVYGIPLSAASGEVDSLEWRFLNWLGGVRLESPAPSPEPMDRDRLAKPETFRAPCPSPALGVHRQA